MSDKIEYSRMLLKRSNVSGVTPTVTSATTLNDFTQTDLFEGEMFLNTIDEKAFVRMNNNILEFDLVSSGGTDYNFCDTGIQTSAISGCSPVEIYDDFNFQSQKNITTSNGSGEISLDTDGFSDSMTMGVSGATYQDFLRIDPLSNIGNGTQLLSTDFTDTASLNLSPNYMEMFVSDAGQTLYTNFSLDTVVGKAGSQSTMLLEGNDDTGGNFSIAAETGFGLNPSRLSFDAGEYFFQTDPTGTDFLFGNGFNMDVQFDNQIVNMFNGTPNNTTINIGKPSGNINLSADTTVTGDLTMSSGSLIKDTTSNTYIELEDGFGNLYSTGENQSSSNQQQDTIFLDPSLNDNGTGIQSFDNVTTGQGQFYVTPQNISLLIDDGVTTQSSMNMTVNDISLVTSLGGNINLSDTTVNGDLTMVTSKVIKSSSNSGSTLNLNYGGNSNTVGVETESGTITDNLILDPDFNTDFGTSFSSYDSSNDNVGQLSMSPTDCVFNLVDFNFSEYTGGLRVLRDTAFGNDKISAALKTQDDNTSASSTLCSLVMLTDRVTQQGNVDMVAGHNMELKGLNMLDIVSDDIRLSPIGLSGTINIGGGGGTINLSGDTTVTGVATLSEYTVLTVPTASSYQGGMIMVTDETGGYTPAFCDGTNWRRTSDRAIIS